MAISYMRQAGLINMTTLHNYSFTLIGAGAIGSFTALTLTKMGVGNLTIFDEDGIAEHNLPNQFYRKKDIGQFKVDSLTEMVGEFCDVSLVGHKRFYSNDKLSDIVVVATDSMYSRKMVWEQFKHQDQAKVFIEARMGAELGIVYCITSKSEEDVKFYESTLYSDDKVKPLACTAKSIICNVLMISSLICRAVKALVNGEKFPRETIFNMEHINKSSFLIRE